MPDKEIKKEKKQIEETAIQEIVNHFFYSKGLTLEKIKGDAKKKKIIYSRYTRPAKQLLELAGSVKQAKKAIDQVAQWANSRDLDYAIETVFKKWLELDRLKPKEVIKKAFFQDMPMVWSRTKESGMLLIKTANGLNLPGKNQRFVGALSINSS